MIERFFDITEPRHTLTFTPSPDEDFEPLRLSLPAYFLSDGRMAAASIQIYRAVKDSCSFDGCDPRPTIRPSLGNEGGLVLGLAGFKCQTAESCPLRDLGGEESGDNQPLTPFPQQPSDRIAVASL